MKYILFVFFFISCSDRLSDKNLLPDVKKHRQYSSKEGSDKDQKWKKLAEFLKVPSGFPHPEGNLKGEEYVQASKEELIKQLSTPTDFFLEKNQEEYISLVESIRDKFKKEHLNSVCSSIKTVTPWTPKKQKTESFLFDMYHLSYEIGDDKKQGILRSAFISLPKKNGKFSQIIYGHGGDYGLSFDDELKQYLSILENNIFIAPTFPGEPWCESKPIEQKILCKEEETVAFASQAKRSPWDKDSDEILGLYDCLFTYPEMIPDYKNKIQHIEFKNKSFNSVFQNRPKTTFMGFSRGGLTISLALAKIGAQWSDPSIEKYPPMISGAAWISAPSSFLIGTIRFLLSLAVKDQLLTTIGAKLPGVEDLDSLFEDYRKSEINNIAILEDLREKILSKDGLFLSPLVIGALKDWGHIDFDIEKLDRANISEVMKNPARFIKKIPMGKTLWLHGQEDKVVEIEQSVAMVYGLKKFIENETVLEKTNTESESFRPYFRSFEYPKKIDKPKIEFQHGDYYFFKSKGQIPYKKLEDLYQKPFPFSLLPKEPHHGGLSPIRTLQLWLNL